MPSQDKLLLVASVDSHNSLTKLFDFVWPGAVALWNLQWQAKGFLAQMPTATEEDLAARFVTGSGIRGSNLRRLVADRAWPELQQWFARLLLAEICALFEGWIEAAIDELAVPPDVREYGNRRTLDKSLQYPTKTDAAGNVVGGASEALSILQGTGSLFFQACILPELLGNQKHAFLALDNLLICYRAFKEVRNDFTHHGGRASARSIAAWGVYQGETATTLGVSEKPEIPILTLGGPINLALRGVVGFGDIVLRIIATYDFIFSDSEYAENLLRRRWIAKHGGKVTVKGVSARDGQIKRLIRQCGAPAPIDLDLVYLYLLEEGLVF